MSQQLLTKFLPWGYLGGSLTYLFANSYTDAKYMVTQFKNNKIDDFDKKYHKIDSELSAAQYGATRYLGLYMPLSLIWPLAAPFNVIPYMVASSKNE